MNSSPMGGCSLFHFLLSDFTTRHATSFSVSCPAFGSEIRCNGYIYGKVVVALFICSSFASAITTSTAVFTLENAYQMLVLYFFLF